MRSSEIAVARYRISSMRSQESIRRLSRLTISRTLRGFIVLASACLLLCGRSYPQVTTADVLGTVSDQAGAIVPGAKIELTNLGTGVVQKTTSNHAGDYLFTLLLPGRYSLSIQATGFKTVSYEDISLAAGDRVREDCALSPGDVQETVVVSAVPPLLQTDSSSVSSVMTERSVQDLPLNGRNFVNLVQIQAGVNQGQGDAIASGGTPNNREESSVVVAGGQSDLYNNFMIDGMDNNEREQGMLGVRPSVDAIAEVKVDANSYSAELGRNAGAVVNIITKSGTNQYHGSAYEFFRNDVLDARNYFTTVASKVPKPEYRLNQFGGSIGGPVIKDKTFFFGDIEDSRRIQGTTQALVTVPTAYEEKSGGTDFSDNGGTVVPTYAISAPGLAYFKMYPAPNTGAVGQTFQNYVADPSESQYSLSLDGRIDHNFRSGDQLYARYSYNNVKTNVPGLFPAVTINQTTIDPGGNPWAWPGLSTTKAHGVAFGFLHPMTPSLVLELKAGYTRIDIESFPLDYGENVSTAIGVVNANTPTAPGTSGLMPLTFLEGGFADIGELSVPILDRNNTFQYMGSITYTHGSHNFKTGGQLMRRQLNYFQNNVGLGIAGFAGLTGNAMEDLVVGLSVGYWRWNALVEPGYRGWEYSGYGLDDWRITHSLTLNLGVRYDVFTALTEAHNHYANFEYPTLSILTASQDPHIGIHANYTNFSPRVGFSQTLRKTTVLRGGFGISYYPTVVQQAISGLTNPPYSFDTGTVINPYWWPDMPLPTATSTATASLSGSLVYVPKDYNTAYIEQFNLALQQQFGANVLTVGGIGELGRHQPFTGSINAPRPTGPYPDDAISGPQATPGYTTAGALPNVTSVVVYAPWATSNYYALQTDFARRFTKGLAFDANYTWAHGLSDSSLSGSGFESMDGLVPSNPRYDYGNSNVDVRHRVAVNVTYTLPFAASATGAKALFFKGWEPNLILLWQTPPPFTVINTKLNPNNVAQINLPGDASDRPNIVPGVNVKAKNPSEGRWFNLSAFTPQEAGTPGNERNNAFYGPHYRGANFSLLKSFAITEKVSAQFRAECYNISNTPSFGNPASAISSWNPGPEHTPTTPISVVGLLPGDTPSGADGFGAIGGASDPREYQFALKFLF